MRKIFTAIALSLTMVVLSPTSISAQKADGQLCHDGTECASKTCGLNGAGYRVCLPNPNPEVNINVTNQTLNAIDPLLIGGSTRGEQFSTPGGIISRVLEYAFPLAGIILFVMIVIGGFQMVLGAGEQKAMEGGRQRVTMAIVGFILLFSAYWVAQILESLFNIKIL